jgi:hypothetical protein
VEILDDTVRQPNQGVFQMLKSKLVVGALVAVFAVGVSSDMVYAKSAKHTSKAPKTAAECSAKYKSYNPMTMTWYGHDNKFHKCP